MPTSANPASSLRSPRQTYPSTQRARRSAKGRKDFPVGFSTYEIARQLAT